MTNTAPQFVASITLYPSSKGGRDSAIVTEWYGCPCKFHPQDFSAFDCRIHIQGDKFLPGETRQLGIIFGLPEATAVFRKVGRFYLCEGRITIGEAVAVG
jgi:hypothetical protein